MTVKEFSKKCANAAINILIWEPCYDEDAVYGGAIEDTPEQYADREIDSFEVYSANATGLNEIDVMFILK